MPIRAVKRVVDTSAKGQNFKEDELYERYFIGISLVSLKTIAKHDLMNRTNEFYFKCDGGKAIKSRTPDIGTINLRENQVFEAKSDQLTIWSEFITLTKNQDKITVVRVISLVILLFSGFGYIKKLKPDIIHSHSADLGFFISIPAKYYDIPVVNTCHGVTFPDK